MIPLESQVCSLDLAKKLKELGVKQESLFGWYGTEYQKNETDIPQVHLMGSGDEMSWHYTLCSAFTASELGEMLPECCEHYQTPRGTRAREKGKWKTTSEFAVTHPAHAETEADARAKMLIHLLETGIVKNDV